VCSSDLPLGFSPRYYHAHQDPAFAGPLGQHVEAHAHDGPCDYAPWCSHVLLAHAAQARPMDEDALPIEANHLERLGWVLNSVAEAPQLIRQAAIGAWFNNAATLMLLLPEALDFFRLAMPHAETMLLAVYGKALARSGGAR
jgi:hypothetical protein